MPHDWGSLVRFYFHANLPLIFTYVSAHKKEFNGGKGAILPGAWAWQKRDLCCWKFHSLFCILNRNCHFPDFQAKAFTFLHRRTFCRTTCAPRPSGPSGRSAPPPAGKGSSPGSEGSSTGIDHFLIFTGHWLFRSRARNARQWFEAVCQLMSLFGLRRSFLPETRRSGTRWDET